MKIRIVFLLLITFSAFFVSCEKIKDVFNKDSKELSGDPSDLGAVGTTFSTTSADVAGVNNVAVSVTTQTDGISTFTGTAKCTNQSIKNILTNFPEFTVNGDDVSVTGVKFKVLKDGVESVHGLDPGVIVKYDAKVGDTYPIANTGGERKVVSKSSDDDYPYGFFYIKVLKVEENTNKMGVKKITYWANHKFGLVGIEMAFDDGTSAKFPIYSSAENQ
jgi:hypothetical protein